MEPNSNNDLFYKESVQDFEENNENSKMDEVFNEYEKEQDNNNDSFCKKWCKVFDKDKNVGEKQDLENLSDFFKALNGLKTSNFCEKDGAVLLTDIEGDFVTQLTALKTSGVIENIRFDKNQKVSFDLCKDFKGSVAFCGDLTSFKGNQLRNGNNIVIDVFNKLLFKIKKHNNVKGINKDNIIKFAAVPGNHEFEEFCGGADDRAIVNNKNNAIIKLEALKCIASIQEYYLSLAKKYKFDITDDDYNCHCKDNQTKIKKLDNYILKINNAIKEINKQKLKCLESDISVLKWNNSELLNSLILNYKSKKIRLIHSFALHIPKKFAYTGGFSDNYAIKQHLGEDVITADNQKEVFKNINDNSKVNTYGIGKKRVPNEDKELFAKNIDPTICGHQGIDINSFQEISGNVYCIDLNAHQRGNNYMFVITKDNKLKVVDLSNNQLVAEKQLVFVKNEDKNIEHGSVDIKQNLYHNKQKKIFKNIKVPLFSKKKAARSDAKTEYNKDQRPAYFNDVIFRYGLYGKSKFEYLTNTEQTEVIRAYTEHNESKSKKSNMMINNIQRRTNHQYNNLGIEARNSSKRNSEEIIKKKAEKYFNRHFTEEPFINIISRNRVYGIDFKYLNKDIQNEIETAYIKKLKKGHNKEKFY